MLLPGMLDVIKIVAEDEAALAMARREYGERDTVLCEACRVYLHGLLLHPAASDHMRLGLSTDATDKDIRDHKRWLLKWLHPDRNPSKWEAALFQRVQEAASNLERGHARTPPTSVFTGQPRSEVRRSSGLRPTRAPVRTRDDRKPYHGVLRILRPIVLAAASGILIAVCLVNYLSRSQDDLRFLHAWMW